MTAGHDQMGDEQWAVVPQQHWEVPIQGKAVNKVAAGRQATCGSSCAKVT